MNAIVAGLGPLDTPELIIIVILVLILFDAKKLPTFARSLGRSMGEFRRAKEKFERELKKSIDHRLPRHDLIDKDALVTVMMIITLMLLVVGLCLWLGW